MRSRLRVTAVALALAAVTASGGTAAHATGVLDQTTGDSTCCISVQIGHNQGVGDFINAQTFTAGITGYLDTAELFIYQHAFYAGGRYRVRITRLTADGAPDEQQTLATAVLDTCRAGQLTSDPPSQVLFSPAPAVTRGLRYALVVEYGPDTRGEHAASWDGGPLDLPGGMPWSKRTDVASPVWQSMGPSKPLSLHTYVSAVQPLPLTRDMTSTALNVTPSTPRRFQPLQLTAHVADSTHTATVPPGTVRFFIDGSPQPPVVVDAGGAAQMQTSFATAGDHAVSAAYCPATASSPMISSEQTATVPVSADRWETETTLSTDPDPSVAWEPVALVADVATADEGLPFPPTGTVTFTEEDGTPIGAPLPIDNDGEAALFAEAGAGDYVIFARYSGDEIHAPSTDSVTQQVDRDTTTTRLTSTAAAVAGKPFAVSAGVDSSDRSDGIPTGAVQFALDGVPAGNPVTLDDDGHAAGSVTAAQAGSASITARYLGDDDYLPSDAQLTRTVTAAPAVVPAAPSATPSPPPLARPAPLAPAQLLAAVHVPRVVIAPPRGTFTVATVDAARLRSLTAEIAARHGNRAVVLARGRLSKRKLVARLTAAGRAALAHRRRAHAQLTLRATDDTGHTLTARRAVTLRGR
jgi:hypothetical protein